MQPSAPNDASNPEQIAHLRHELLTSINHILGLTELQMDEAPESGLHEYVPALAEINARGRKLLAIIEAELGHFSGPSGLKHLDARLEYEGRPTLGQARTLAEQLHAIGRQSAAEEMDLVSGALETLLSISHAMVQDSGAGESAEPIKK
jgi:signal transduction histidine kinase